MINKTIKTRDKSKKRNMIIEGAIKSYMEHGYKNVSMDTIAEYAGVSKKTIYHWFWLSLHQLQWGRKSKQRSSWRKVRSISQRSAQALYPRRPMCNIQKSSRHTHTKAELL